MSLASRCTERRTRRLTPLRPPHESRGTYGGRGNTVVRLEPLAHLANIATIEHRGEQGFSVWSVDRGGEDIEQLVATRGPYCGVVPLDFSAEPAAFRVTADGDWRVETAPLDSAKSWTGRERVDGSGDSVLALDDPRADPVRARVRVSEGSHLAVWSWGERRELLARQDAPSVARIEIPADAVVLAVRTDGRWSVAPEAGAP